MIGYPANIRISILYIQYKSIGVKVSKTPQFGQLQTKVIVEVMLGLE